MGISYDGFPNSRFHALLFGINRLRSETMPLFVQRAPVWDHLCNYTFVQLSPFHSTGDRNSSVVLAESLTLDVGRKPAHLAPLNDSALVCQHLSSLRPRLLRSLFNRQELDNAAS